MNVSNEKVQGLVSSLACQKPPFDFWIDEYVRVNKSDVSFKFLFHPEKNKSFSMVQSLAKATKTVGTKDFPNFGYCELQAGRVQGIVAQGWIGLFKNSCYHVLAHSQIIVRNTNSLPQYFETVWIASNQLIERVACKEGYYISSMDGKDINRIVEIIGRVTNLNSSSLGTRADEKSLANQTSIGQSSKESSYKEIAKLQSELGVFILYANQVFIGNFSDKLSVWAYLEEGNAKIILPNGESLFESLSEPIHYASHIKHLWDAFKELTMDPDEVEADKKSFLFEREAVQATIKRNNEILKLVSLK